MCARHPTTGNLLSILALRLKHPRRRITPRYHCVYGTYHWQGSQLREHRGSDEEPMVGLAEEAFLAVEGAVGLAVGSVEFHPDP